MRANVIQLVPPDAGANGEPEPLEAAVLEVSGEIAANSDGRRRLFARLDELRGAGPRRRRARVSPAAPSRPITFFSIEDADAPSEPGPLQAA